MSWNWDRDSLASLRDFLKERELMDGEPSLSPIGDGHSNLTYDLKGGSRPMILRRPPPPPLPRGSNDVLREARVIAAVGDHGVPVPHILAIAETGQVLDVPFYIMSRIDGDVITTEMPARFRREGAARQVGEALVDAMVALHRVDWRSAGLDDFGRPENFNRRHLERMAGLRDRLGADHRSQFDQIREWLDRNCPAESGACIIHNDLRIGNVMWDPGADPKIAAILDWELATIGDPMLDLAYLLASLPVAGECRTPVQDLAAACRETDFPGPDHLVRRYEAVSRVQVPALNWHLAMVNWKLAILYLYSRESGRDPYYQDDSLVRRFLEEAARHAGMGFLTSSEPA